MTVSTMSIGAKRRVETAVVAAVTVLVAVGTSQIEAEPTERPADWLAFVCGMVAASSLVFWRRWPIIVASVVSIAFSVYLARRYPPGPSLLPVPMAMAALGYLLPRRASWLGVGGMLAVSAVGTVIANESILPHLLLIVGWGVAGVLAGQALSAREDRAEAERERIAHAHERALATERLRIAQDLHDSVAHAMATINVQSGVAAHLVDRKPEQAATALEAIRSASGDALDELAAILGVLRESGSAAPLAPLPGLDQIGELIDRARSDGVRVTYDQTGDIEPLSPTIGAAAYRAVQEALTNTRRHAGPLAKVTVAVASCERGSLRVTVADDGGDRVSPDHEAAQSPGGFGLVGMRERVESSGGVLTVGPTPSAGFRVEAAWPERTD